MLIIVTLLIIIDVIAFMVFTRKENESEELVVEGNWQ